MGVWGIFSFNEFAVFFFCISGSFLFSAGECLIGQMMHYGVAIGLTFLLSGWDSILNMLNGFCGSLCLIFISIDLKILYAYLLCLRMSSMSRVLLVVLEFEVCCHTILDFHLPSRLFLSGCHPLCFDPLLPSRLY